MKSYGKILIISCCLTSLIFCNNPNFKNFFQTQTDGHGNKLYPEVEAVFRPRISYAYFTRLPSFSSFSTSNNFETVFSNIKKIFETKTSLAGIEEGIPLLRNYFKQLFSLSLTLDNIATLNSYISTQQNPLSRSLETTIFLFIIKNLNKCDKNTISSLIVFINKHYDKIYTLLNSIFHDIKLIEVFNFNTQSQLDLYHTTLSKIIKLEQMNNFIISTLSVSFPFFDTDELFSLLIQHQYKNILPALSSHTANNTFKTRSVIAQINSEVYYMFGITPHLLSLLFPITHHHFQPFLNSFFALPSYSERKKRFIQFIKLENYLYKIAISIPTFSIYENPEEYYNTLLIRNFNTRIYRTKHCTNSRYHPYLQGNSSAHGVDMNTIRLLEKEFLEKLYSSYENYRSSLQPTLDSNLLFMHNEVTHFLLQRIEEAIAKYITQLIRYLKEYHNHRSMQDSSSYEFNVNLTSNTIYKMIEKKLKHIYQRIPISTEAKNRLEDIAHKEAFKKEAIP